MNIRTPLPLEEKSLADYVVGHARRFGGRPAIEYLGVTITYRELDRLANRLANLLRELGVGQGDVVGIHLPNTPQYLIALVAASKLGAAISGVSPLLKASEIVHQVNDAHIKVLLSLDQLFNHNVAPIDGQVPGLRAVLVCGPIDFLPLWKKKLAYALRKLPKVTLKKMQSVRVLDGWKRLNAASARKVETRVHLADTVLVQYTGGTTGKPKGAALSLRALQAEASQMEQLASYADGRETVASAFPYFHTAGLLLGILGLMHAARILVIPDPRNVELFCKAMQKYPPTMLANVPTLFQMLLDAPAFKRIDFSQLKMAVSGAAPFSPELIHRLESVIGKGMLCEGYGMTELCGVAVMNPPGHARIGTVGLPLPNVRVKIVDVETGLVEQPQGEAGEIIVQAPQAMTGYLGSPESTAKTLREFQGETWLYTGDVGTLDADGYLTICDRAKDMLIVGGYKVFSAEVESKLAELDCVELCAVIGTPDTKRPGNDIVNLFVQLKGPHRQRETRQVEEEILRFCREHMSAYKVPKQVHFQAALPLTAVGKLDKKALRLPAT